MLRKSLKTALSSFALVALVFGIFSSSLTAKAAFEAKADVRSQRNASNEDTLTHYVSVPSGQPSLSGYTSARDPIQFKLDPSFFTISGSDVITFIGSMGGGGSELPSVENNVNEVLMTDGEDLMWSEPELAWGSIVGDIANQTDLQAILSNISASHTALVSVVGGKQNALTSGTSTGQVLQWNGSVYSPAFIGKADVGLGNVVNLDTSTTANIADSLNKRFVTDAQKALLDGSLMAGANNLSELTNAATARTNLGLAI